MGDFEYYHSENQKLIIIVFDRINGIKGYCFSLSCSCDCGDSCDFEQNETIKDRFPDAIPIQKNK